MQTARLILNHREDLVLPLKDFYLGSGRTSRLVMAVNPNTVNIRRFKEDDSFRLTAHAFPRPDGTASMRSRNWRVWAEVAKQFPQIDMWVAHDYDLTVLPGDADITAHVKPSEYAMIGTAFPIWQEGMKDVDFDTYPFPEGHRYWRLNSNPYDRAVEAALLKYYPVDFQNIQTVMAGYGDFVATSRENLLRLDDDRLKLIDVFGGEQVPHTIWRVQGIRPVDMRQFYKTKVLMDVVYTPMDVKYDFVHPVKFWPGQPVDKGLRKQNRTYKFKNFVKRLIRYKNWK